MTKMAWLMWLCVCVCVCVCVVSVCGVGLGPVLWYIHSTVFLVLGDKTTSKLEITSPQPVEEGRCVHCIIAKQSHLSSPERGVTVSALKMEK